MGLKLRYHLFHGVDHADLFAAYAAFYEEYGYPLRVEEPGPERGWHQLQLHERDGRWTVLNSHGG